MGSFGMRGLSFVGRGRLEHAVTLGLVVQGARCGSVWQLWVQEVCGISLIQPAGVHSINNCVLLGEHCGGFAVTSRPLRSSAAPPGSDQGRQWLEVVVFTYLPMGYRYRCLSSGSVGCRHT